MAFKVTRAKKSDIDDVWNFFQLVRQRNALFLLKDKSDILRKFENPGHSGKNLTLFLLRDPEGSLVGCSGYVPFSAKFATRDVPGFFGSDTVIDPEARKKFPFLAFMLARSYENLVRKQKSLPLICPASPGVSDNFKSVQWGDFCTLHKLVNRVITSIFPESPESGIRFIKVDSFKEPLTPFFDRISQQHEFLLNVCADTMNAKYFKGAKNYAAILAVKQDMIIGYIVAEKRLDDIYIVDITIDLHFPKVMLLLLFECFKAFERLEHCPVIVYLSHKRYIEIFKKVGFVVEAEIDCLFFKFGSLMTAIPQKKYYAEDKSSYHFNGFTNYLY